MAWKSIRVHNQGAKLCCPWLGKHSGTSDLGSSFSTAQQGEEQHAELEKQHAQTSTQTLGGAGGGWNSLSRICRLLGRFRHKKIMLGVIFHPGSYVCHRASMCKGGMDSALNIPSPKQAGNGLKSADTVPAPRPTLVGSHGPIHGRQPLSGCAGCLSPLFTRLRAQLIFTPFMCVMAQQNQSRNARLILHSDRN